MPGYITGIHTADSWTRSFLGRFQSGMTTALSISGLMSHRTVRTGRFPPEFPISEIFPAEADLNRFDPAEAPFLAGFNAEVTSASGLEDCAAVGAADDFLEKSWDRKRNLPAIPADFPLVRVPPVGSLAGETWWDSWTGSEDDEVAGVVRLCQLRDRIARCLARCWTKLQLRLSMTCQTEPKNLENLVNI